MASLPDAKKLLICFANVHALPIFLQLIPPLVAAAGIKAFGLLQESNDLQDKLHENVGITL